MVYQSWSLWYSDYVSDSHPLLPFTDTYLRPSIDQSFRGDRGDFLVSILRATVSLDEDHGMSAQVVVRGGKALSFRVQDLGLSKYHEISRLD